jgi:hypothetical protein
VTPVLPNEILAVTDDPSVINLIFVPLTCVNGLASVKTPCPSIRVFCDGGMLIEGLGKPLSAHITLHIGRLLILSTTGAMNHELFNELKQLRVVHRELRRHEAVHLLWCTQLGMWFKEDNDMSMRKAPLLELNGIKEACRSTKHAIFNVFNEGEKLGIEDTCDKIRTLSSCLVVKQSILNLWPSRIGSHGDEKVSSSKIPVNGQGILTVVAYNVCHQ